MRRQTPPPDRPPISVELIAHRIYRIRGEKVMLDSDLAALYQVITGNLNLAVRQHQTLPERLHFSTD
jgi:hypothetical protein